MRRRRKADLSNASILAHVPTIAMVPDRCTDRWYATLESFGLSDLSRDIQPIAVLAAWYWCRIFDVMDRRYLYGEQWDIAEAGTPVLTQQDRKEKQAELELLPKLQKGLFDCVAELRKSRSKDPDVDPFAKLHEALGRVDGDSNSCYVLRGSNSVPTPIS
jgi:hypothetical protein